MCSQAFTTRPSSNIRAFVVWASILCVAGGPVAGGLGPAAGFTISSASAATRGEIGVSETYGQLPLQFEENRGQAHGDVRFISRGHGYSVYLTANEAVLALAFAGLDANVPDVPDSPPVDIDRTAAQLPGPVPEPEQGAARQGVVRIGLVGAAQSPAVSGLDELPGKVNYLIGLDANQWQTNVPTFARVRYSDVYPGIDLVWYGNRQQLEYSFLVAPGGDPALIELVFGGVNDLEVDGDGTLVMHAAKGAMQQRKLAVYQNSPSGREIIEGDYVIKGSNRIGFEVGPYDMRRPLIIDPVLVYTAYFGGASANGAADIAVDGAGSAYLAGSTDSIDFPATDGSFALTGGTSLDAFVAKLDAKGSSLLYSTYLGGTGDDRANDIAVDDAGHAYVTGQTVSGDFPTTDGALYPAPAGNSNAFVTKLEPSGSGLVYSNTLGGAERDVGSGIAIDRDGNAYVAGWTRSVDFPITPTAFQAQSHQAMAGNACPCDDAFVAKLNPAGNGLAYSTYLGGDSNDFGLDIAVDAAGSAYVTGQTFSQEFPTTADSFQPGFGGFVDAFIVKFDPGGSALVYGTFLGGVDHDSGDGIATDADGNAYVVGTTSHFGFNATNNFPTTPGALQPGFGNRRSCPPECSGDAFVTKLHASGSALAWSTYLGGDGSDIGAGIDVDAAGNAYVTGTTSSQNFPVSAGVFQPALAGYSDAFITKLNSARGALEYSTYLGGAGEDQGSGIAVMSGSVGGAAYVFGNMRSAAGPDAGPVNGEQPTTAAALQPGFYGGFHVVFVAKVGD